MKIRDEHRSALRVSALKIGKVFNFGRNKFGFSSEI